MTSRPIDRDRLAAWAQEPNYYADRFRNEVRTPSHGLKGFLKWQLERGRSFPKGQRFPLDPIPIATLTPDPATPQIIWLGHSSFLFQWRGKTVLTDPVLSQRASPFSFAGPKRFTPPALSVDQLPNIDIVLISHNHYDHLDAQTVAQLHHRFGDNLHYCVPSGLAAWFQKRQIDRVTELGWWQSERVAPAGSVADIEIFCLPAQHFSGRGATDQNQTLWCSWLIDLDGYRLYFAGDTGYAPVFRRIGEVFAPIDLALLPIGAYAPRWFMAPFHTNPEDAVCIHQDIGARQSIGMHWGTFILTDEPMDEPPQALARACSTAGLAPNTFTVMRHGEARQLPLPHV